MSGPCGKCPACVLAGMLRNPDQDAADFLEDEPVVVTVTVDIEANNLFADAFDSCLDGRRITRAGWNGFGMYVEAQRPDANSKNTEPYLVLVKPTGQRLPWVPSQGDLFATDWAIYP